MPVPKQGNERFFQMHDAFVKRAKAGGIGLLFLGDSITEGWVKAPEIWSHFYKEYQPANFGIAGDRTEHLLWRVEMGS